jgi:hypothetical protein
MQAAHNMNDYRLQWYRWAVATLVRQSIGNSIVTVTYECFKI